MNITAILICRDENVGHILEAAAALADHRIEIVAQASSPADLLSVIRLHNADLVLLDPDIDQGATLVTWSAYVGAIPVLVCVSENGRYGPEAFDAGAAHYVMIQKIDRQFGDAIRRAVVRLLRYDRGGPNGSAVRELQAPFKTKMVALPHATGIEIRSCGQVVSAHGEGNYTRIVLEDDPPMIMSRPIGEYEVVLADAGLVRVHRSHMVNVDHIRRVRRGKTPILELSNGAEIDVSDSYREALFAYLQINAGRRHDRD